jgi:hypothetical protein
MNLFDLTHQKLSLKKNKSRLVKMLVLVVLLTRNVFSRDQSCAVPKAGTDYGEATMFQEHWVHGKTGACGFEKPLSDQGQYSLAQE